MWDPALPNAFANLLQWCKLRYWPLDSRVQFAARFLREVKGFPWYVIPRWICCCGRKVTSIRHSSVRQSRKGDRYIYHISRGLVGRKNEMARDSSTHSRALLIESWHGNPHVMFAVVIPPFLFSMSTPFHVLTSHVSFAVISPYFKTEDNYSEGKGEGFSSVCNRVQGTQVSFWLLPMLFDSCVTLGLHARNRPVYPFYFCILLVVILMMMYIQSNPIQSLDLNRI